MRTSGAVVVIKIGSRHTPKLPTKVGTLSVRRGRRFRLRQLPWAVPGDVGRRVECTRVWGPRSGLGLTWVQGWELGGRSPFTVVWLLGEAELAYRLV